MKKLCSFKLSELTLQRLEVCIEKLEALRTKDKYTFSSPTTKTDVVEQAIQRMYDELTTAQVEKPAELTQAEKKKSALKKGLKP
jgi:cell division protein YceG involved in septum cleavage